MLLFFFIIGDQCNAPIVMFSFQLDTIWVGINVPDVLPRLTKRKSIIPLLFIPINIHDLLMISIFFYIFYIFHYIYILKTSPLHQLFKQNIVQYNNFPKRIGIRKPENAIYVHNRKYDIVYYKNNDNN